MGAFILFISQNLHILDILVPFKILRRKIILVQVSFLYNALNFKTNFKIISNGWKQNITQVLLACTEA